jgi:hypothetical protein
MCGTFDHLENCPGNSLAACLSLVIEQLSPWEVAE